MLNFDQLSEEFKSWCRQIWLDGYRDGHDDGLREALAENLPVVITDLEQTDEHTAAADD
jgi:hypothetical protein